MHLNHSWTQDHLNYGNLKVLQRQVSQMVFLQQKAPLSHEWPWLLLGSAGRVWAPRVNPRCQVVDRGKPRTTVDPTTRSRYFCNNQVKPDQTALGKNTSLRKIIPNFLTEEVNSSAKKKGFCQKRFGWSITNSLVLKTWCLDALTWIQYQESSFVFMPSKCKW